MWNSLPPHLRRDMNFARFKRQLKTFMFGSYSQPRRIVTLCLTLRLIEILLLTYLRVPRAWEEFRDDSVTT